MLMGNCLASMTRLLFLSLWYQEALTERSGKKMEGICPGELLPRFYQQVRAPHALSLLEQEYPHLGKVRAALWEQQGSCVSFRH